jgi:NADPH:quinone reductase-like Zn-dependent oxidoreductase
MKAIQKFGDGKEGMGLVDVPEPVVGPGDLLVEVGAVGPTPTATTWTASWMASSLCWTA